MVPGGYRVRGGAGWCQNDGAAWCRVVPGGAAGAGSRVVPDGASGRPNTRPNRRPTVVPSQVKKRKCPQAPATKLARASHGTMDLAGATAPPPPLVGVYHTRRNLKLPSAAMITSWRVALALGAVVVLGTQYALLGKRCVTTCTGRSHCGMRDTVVTPTPSSPPPEPVPSLLPAPAPQPPSACSWIGEHTEMGGGTVVGGGARLKLENASACCEACLQHNQAVPRPRGRVNCTTWVYNTDPSHAQARECWLKRHESPWSDINLLRGGARSWATGVVLPRPPSVLGIAPTARSCGDGRWRRERSAYEGAVHLRPATPGVHSEEISFCPAVRAAEASVALDLGRSKSVRLRLNRAISPQATAWIDAILDAGSCTAGQGNRSRCAPHCCQFYRAEAAVGVHLLPATLLQAHGLEPTRPPHWGQRFYWGPPYGYARATTIERVERHSLARVVLHRHPGTALGRAQHAAPRTQHTPSHARHALAHVTPPR